MNEITGMRICVAIWRTPNSLVLTRYRRIIVDKARIIVGGPPTKDFECQAEDFVVNCSGNGEFVKTLEQDSD
jgi:hypothetical protein